MVIRKALEDPEFLQFADPLFDPGVAGTERMVAAVGAVPVDQTVEQFDKFVASRGSSTDTHDSFSKGVEREWSARSDNHENPLGHRAYGHLWSDSEHVDHKRPSLGWELMDPYEVKVRLDGQATRNLPCGVPEV